MYQDADGNIRVSVAGLMDALGNIDQKTIAPRTLTADMDTYTNVSGTIPAGLVEIAVANTGNVPALLQGKSIPSGIAVTWRADRPDVLGPMTYDASNTTLIVTTLAIAS